MKRVEDFPYVDLYLYRPHADMRKQITGLSVMVQEHVLQNPFDAVSLSLLIGAEILSRPFTGTIHVLRYG